MIINNIDTENISVVVQGAIDKINTPICLKSIRKYLPGAEIILSTWEGSEVDGLDYDILLLNKDPGNYISDEVNKVYNNVNRQIVSTKNGLKKATKKYAIKIRSDMEIVGTNFLNYFWKFKKRSDIYKILKERVIINNLYTSNAYKTNVLYAVSDWIFFGLTNDILNIWDIPIETENEALYFKNNSHEKPRLFSNLLSRFLVEQYIFINFLKKNNINIDLDFHTDLKNGYNYKKYDLILSNNFVVLNYKNYGIKFLKYNPYKWDYKSQLTYNDWLTIYNKYCTEKNAVKKIAFLIPTYPPHFEYAKNLLKSFYKNKLNEQADLFFIFTDENEKSEFGEYYDYIILPQELRVFENNGIINIKKFYGVLQLKDKYDYIIILDDESKFIKNINLEKLCNDYFKNKILYGNNCSDPCNCASIVHSRLDAIFPNNNIDKNLYLWFNQLCIYKSDTIDDFFNKINYKEIIKKISYHDFDYYIYMYYLILYQGFSIVDMRAECDYGFCENVEKYKLLDGYKKLNLNLSTQYMYKLLKNKDLFVLIHFDRRNGIILKELRILKLTQKFKKHWKNFFQPMEKIVKRFFKWFGEFFAILFYGIKIIIKVLLNFWRLF